MNSNFTTTRRQFLKTMAATAGIAVTGPLLTACAPANFLHGVASGDPLHDRVIIWTRVTPSAAGSVVVFVSWEVAQDDSFRHIVTSGHTYTDETIDYTIKVDAEGLRPDGNYFYRFRCNGFYSVVGKTRTLPVGETGQVTLAVVSCSNYPAGYFNAYREVAKQAQQIDVVLHLGDYIYEYGKDGYASDDAETLGRAVNPTTELLTLSDYRKRYAQYRSDEDLQLVHQQLPFITVWDDHEVANDAWRAGAENHNEGEGSYPGRKAQALQAHYEWLPIRETGVGNRGRIFRSFDFGDLLSLHMLDTRIIGRDKPLAYADYLAPTGAFDVVQFTADLTNSNRQLLGPDQFDWLVYRLQHSTATWQVLGQQVLMTSIALPAPLLFQQISLQDYQTSIIKAQTHPASLTPQERTILSAPSIPFNLDAWDGYPAAREAILQTALAYNKNLICLAGDTHNSWAGDLTNANGTTVGVEFATPSVSSPGLEAVLTAINPEDLANALTTFSKPLKYTNTQHRGFMKLTLTHHETTCEWIFIDTVKSRQYRIVENANKRLNVLPGVGGLQLVEG